VGDARPPGDAGGRTVSGDPEMMLLARVIDTGDIITVIEAGVTDSWFASGRGQASWSYVRSYWAQHREVPTEEAFTRRFPDGRLEPNGEPLGALVAELRAKRGYLLLRDGLQESVKHLTAAVATDRPALVEEVSTYLASMLAEIVTDTSESTVESVTAGADDYLEYVMTKEPLSVTGVHTGIDFIDRVTGGMQPEQLYILGGPPKSGKSTIALWCAMQAHAQGETVLFVGHEMSNEEQRQRHFSLGAEVSLNLIKEGLRDSPHGPTAERRIRAFVKELRGYAGELYFVHDNNPFLSGIAAKVEQYHPTVVVVDGLYLMHDDNGEPDGSPQALTNISRAIKRLARARGISIFATTQVLESKMTKHGGVTLFSFGYTSAFGQDADTVLGIWRPDHTKAESNMRVVASRNSLGAEGTVEIDLHHGRIIDTTGDNEVADTGSSYGSADVMD
jgi:replicative DNA helicase